eukprot:jgi/Tetstr1/465313/TSEL_010009.t1
MVWTGGWSEADMRLAIGGAKAAGYDLVEVATLNPATFLGKASATRAVLEEMEMSVANSLGLPPDKDINSEDKECVARGVEELTAAVEVAHRMGSKYVCGVIYCALQKYPGPPTPAGRRNCAAAIAQVADIAADKGVTLGLEVVNRYETNLLNTAAQAMDFISDVGRDNVMVHLDTYHMNIEEVSMQDAVRTCGNKLGYVHVGESHRGHLGTGSVDFRGLFDALAAIDYSGPITFESFSSRVVSLDLSNTLAVWREMWDDSDDLAVRSKAFIDAHLANAAALRP